MIFEGDLDDFDNLCNVVTLYIYDKVYHKFERAALAEKLKKKIAELSEEDRKRLKEYVEGQFYGLHHNKYTVRNTRQK